MAFAPPDGRSVAATAGETSRQVTRPGPAGTGQGAAGKSRGLSGGRTEPACHNPGDAGRSEWRRPQRRRLVTLLFHGGETMNQMKLQRHLVLGLLAAAPLMGCPSSARPYEVADGYIYVQKEGRRNDATPWELVWEDDFDKGALDAAHWTRLGLFTTPEIKLPVERWQENKGCFRYITATDDRVVRFDEDNIHLRGIVNDNPSTGDPRPFLTGGISTRHKFAFQYGRIEIRAKLEPAHGAWPAIWMKSEKAIYPNQHNGEMDIMERLNHDDFAYQTTHSHWTINLKQASPRKSATGRIAPGGYNVYSVSWYPDKLVYAINGVETITYPKVPGGGTFQWPFDQPFFLYMDQQLEGSWPGKVTHPEELPVGMVVDWVRLYQ